MQTYWLSDSESSEKFWEHEWAAHGTCVSTLDPDCYDDYQTGEEAAAFFQIVVNLFKSLDTYSVSFLSSCYIYISLALPKKRNTETH